MPHLLVVGQYIIVDSIFLRVARRRVQSRQICLVNPDRSVSVFAIDNFATLVAAHRIVGPTGLQNRYKNFAIQ